MEAGISDALSSAACSSSSASSRSPRRSMRFPTSCCSVFGAILVAVVLRTIARPIQPRHAARRAPRAAGRRARRSRVLGGTGYLFGAQISDQLVFADPTASRSRRSRLSKSVPFLRSPSWSKDRRSATCCSTPSRGARPCSARWRRSSSSSSPASTSPIKPDVYRNGFIMLFPKRDAGADRRHSRRLPARRCACGSAGSCWR